MVNQRLSAHAGGVLVYVEQDGLTVQYTGACTGCPYRSLTTEAVVKPALRAVVGVDAVRVVGSRVSDEAAQRLAQLHIGRFQASSW